MAVSPDSEKHLKLIFGYLSVLRESISQEDKKWLVDAIEGELRTLFARSKDLKGLEISMEEQKFLLQPLLKEVIHGFSGELRRKGVIIDYDVNQEVPEVVGIPSAVRQAVKNVLEEAIKSLKEGGVITVSEERKEDRVILKVIEQDKGGVMSLELPLAPRGSEVLQDELSREMNLPLLKGRGLILFSISGLGDLEKVSERKRVEDFLSSFQDRLTRTLRKGDRVISDGEGEFLVIIRNVEDASQVKSVMNRLRKIVQPEIEPPLRASQSFSFVGPTDFPSSEDILSDLRKKVSG